MLVCYTHNLKTHVLAFTIIITNITSLRVSGNVKKELRRFFKKCTVVAIREAKIASLKKE